MRNYLLLFLCCLLAPFALIHSQAQNITTIAGTGTYGYSGDGGPATVAAIEYAWYNVVDKLGNIYFTDNANHRVRKIDAAGVITTIAGNGLPGFSGDGGPATAAMNSAPSGIAVDGAGNVYFADVSTRRVRKINATGTISTIAGTGTAGSAGDGGPATAAQLNTPYGVMLDAAGNIYISDVGGNRIRKINSAGTISTIAGTGVAGFSGDGGPATAAKLSAPGCTAVDMFGNLYIADISNNRIRKVSTTGTISTVAGNGIAGYMGDGGAATAAQLNQPLSVAADGIGNIFISDQWNNRVRKVNTSGMISTIVGNGVAAYSGDGGPASAASIKQSIGISRDTTGDLYLCDRGNFRVRRVSYNNRVPAFTSGAVDSFALCENDSININSLLSISDADTAQLISWDVLSGPYHGSCITAYAAPSVAGTVTPVGFMYTPVTGYAGRDTMRVRVNDGFSIDTITIYGIVKPLPNMGPVTGPSFICIGTADTVRDTAAGGVWSATNGNATVSSVGVLHGIVLGKDTIVYTNTLAGCVSSASKEIDVYPVSDSISGVSAVCVATVVTWIGYPPGGTWTASNSIAVVTGGVVWGVSPGKDTITYTVSNPCGTTSFKKVITVNAMIAPTVVIGASPSAFILAGETDTLTAHVFGGGGIEYDYQWQLNGWNISGATDSVYISSTLHDGDSVTCIVTNGPCSAASFAWIYIVWVEEGVPTLSYLNDDIKAVPNPSSGRFSIEGMNHLPGDKVTLQLTDVTGNIVYSETVPVVKGAVRKEIDLDNRVVDGLYLLHVITGEGKKVIRVNVNR